MTPSRGTVIGTPLKSLLRTLKTVVFLSSPSEMLQQYTTQDTVAGVGRSPQTSTRCQGLEYMELPCLTYAFVMSSGTRSTLPLTFLFRRASVCCETFQEAANFTNTDTTASSCSSSPSSKKGAV